mmetsp:Transcript_95109/g.273842  ORF Transcript_95109/g.273842 Transcript_95109/m.273842 type:complete len:322 (+) Transcript_95109:56-1021(+)
MPRSRRCGTLRRRLPFEHMQSAASPRPHARQSKCNYMRRSTGLPVSDSWRPRLGLLRPSRPDRPLSRISRGILADSGGRRAAAAVQRLVARGCMLSPFVVDDLENGHLGCWDVPGRLVVAQSLLPLAQELITVPDAREHGACATVDEARRATTHVLPDPTKRRWRGHDRLAAARLQVDTTTAPRLLDEDRGRPAARDWANPTQHPGPVRYVVEENHVRSVHDALLRERATHERRNGHIPLNPVVVHLRERAAAQVIREAARAPLARRGCELRKQQVAKLVQGGRFDVFGCAKNVLLALGSTTPAHSPTSDGGPRWPMILGN